MKIGSLSISLVCKIELLVPLDVFYILNQNYLNWYPDDDLKRADEGWVWFTHISEYRRAKRLIEKEYEKIEKQKGRYRSWERI